MECRPGTFAESVTACGGASRRRRVGGLGGGGGGRWRAGGGGGGGRGPWGGGGRGGRGGGGGGGAGDPVGGGEWGQRVRGEVGWPSVTAVLVGMLLTLARPKEMRLAPVWVLPAVEIVLLAMLIARDPGRIDKRSSLLRGVSIVVVAVLVLDAMVATVRLIAVLIRGGSMTNSPEALLAAGGVVWLSNLIVFALLYWELDA